MAQDTDVLVVGAGPIGLINAWGMKRLNPKLKIVVLEKYAAYQRSHTLVMQWQHLEAVMKATHTEQDPELVALLKQLKKDPHIRTNTLQETFTKLAKKSGVEVLTQQEVKKDTLKQKLKTDYPKARLVIGADGTHSVVSETLFPKDNQVKHDFDYVLQLRFDINGDEKAPGLRATQFYQQMARKGLIANEYVGNFENGKTPVTMQMMISKEDYLLLQKLTSKDPAKPYAQLEGKDAAQLPVHLKSFLATYIKNKIEDARAAGQELDNESIRISVNEAPATHAKKVVNKRGNARVVLKGDAALGLSYFKGLNAGLEASAKFLSTMADAIQDSFNDTNAMDEQLKEYQDWFLNDFSPKKVKEVGQYSFWQIRSVMEAMKVVQHIKMASMADDDDDYLDQSIRDYFNHFTKDPLANNVDKKWSPFPHREHDLVKLGQFDHIPLKHTAKKIGKIFIDYLKPYKSNAQLAQDYKQPLVGVANLSVGLAKTVTGVFKINPSTIGDGLFSMLRGTIEVATTPLTWLLKPITRGAATLIHGGYKKIEENSGLKQLAQFGEEYLHKTDDNSLTSNQTMYELLAVCTDLHRKFDKSLARGQSSDLTLEEHSSYAEIRKDNALSREKLLHYFSLFSPKMDSLDEFGIADQHTTSKRH